MDRYDAGWIALVLLGLLVIVAAPPDPQFSVSVRGPMDPPEDEPVVAFADLSEENRGLFLAAREEPQRFAEEPDLRARYVEYEGEVYRVSVSAHEGPVLSLLMPPLGGLLALVGCLVAVYRHLYRS